MHVLSIYHVTCITLVRMPADLPFWGRAIMLLWLLTYSVASLRSLVWERGGTHLYTMSCLSRTYIVIVL